MSSEILDVLIRANLAASAAVLAVLALRTIAARRIGARAAYGLWAAVPLTTVASLLPARTVEAPAAIAPLIPTSAIEAAPDVVGAGAGAAAARFDAAPLLLGLWLAGALVAAGLLVWRQYRFTRALGALEPDGAAYRAQAADAGPAIVGVLRPRIVVPADFAQRFTPEERGMILTHELTHLDRGDHLVNGLAAFAQCLAWFNPLIHLAADRLRLDQELACDATVAARQPKARRAYAEALLKTQLAPLAPPLGCHWPSGAANPLRQRLAMLAAPPPPAARHFLGVALAGGLSLGAGLAAWAAQPARVAPPTAPAASSSLAAAQGRALIEALDDGALPLVEALIGLGADVNQVQPGDGTPLLVAARKGDLAAMRLLLDKGADPDRAAPGDGNPLIAAAAHGQLEAARLLVARGANVNANVLKDETPLINAARRGDLAMVQFLVGQGADVNLAVRADGGPIIRSPLNMARDPAVRDYLRAQGARR